MIDTVTLIKFGAKKVSFPKNSIIFREGEHALFYWQVAQGVVKMISYNENGKAFIQGVFRKEESFGEPPLFADLAYPGSAVAGENTEVWKLSKEAFFQLLEDNFDLHLKLTQVLSRRLHYKATLLKEISTHSPIHRLMTLIDYLKNGEPCTERFYKVPYTRKELAEMTGLRVETVIRNIKQLEKMGFLTLKNRKIYRKIATSQELSAVKA